jgi:hypothetical protein
MTTSIRRRERDREQRDRDRDHLLDVPSLRRSDPNVICSCQPGRPCLLCTSRGSMSRPNGSSASSSVSGVGRSGAHERGVDRARRCGCLLLARRAGSVGRPCPRSPFGGVWASAWKPAPAPRSKRRASLVSHQWRVTGIPSSW